MTPPAQQGAMDQHDGRQISALDPLPSNKVGVHGRMVSEVGKGQIRLRRGFGSSLMALIDGAGDSQRESGGIAQRHWSRTGPIRG
jgi:hypothetical protein